MDESSGRKSTGMKRVHVGKKEFKIKRLL